MSIRAAVLEKVTPSFEAFELNIHQVPKPQLLPDHVLVRIHASGINNSDVGGVLGYFQGSKIPRIPGRDFAGVVEEGPSEWVGKRIWGSESGIYGDGSLTDYVNVPIGVFGEVPSNISLVQAAACGVPVITAYLALFQTNPLQKGEKVLVTGANGAVGLFAMQLAKWKGGIPVGLVRSSEKREFLKGFGFDSVISTSDQDWQNQVKAAGPFPRVLNSLGNTNFSFLLNDCLADGGTFVTYSAGPGQREITVDLFQTYRRRLAIVGINSAHAGARPGFIFEEVREGFEKGEVKPLIVEPAAIFPLEKAADAYRASKAMQNTRVVVKLSEE